MRVLHILNEFKPSGAEVMLAHAAPLWHAEGIESHALSTGAVWGEYAPTLKSRGFQLHHIPFSRDLSYFRALRQLVARGQYDIVHIHPERAFFWMALAARAGGAGRIVRSVHSIFAFSGALRRKRQFQRALLRRLGVEFISVSTSVQDNEWQRFLNPTRHMRSWIDTDVFTPPTPAERASSRRKFGLDDDTLTLTTVGNCAPVKNHLAVIQALPDLEDLRPVYLHAGAEQPGRPEYTLAVSLGIDERCWFLGPVTNVPELLHATDVYVMPSYHEGLPIAALEAAATGLRCVLPRVPGFADIEACLGTEAVWIEPNSDAVAAGIREADSLTTCADAERLHDVIASEFGMQQRALDFAGFYRSL